MNRESLRKEFEDLRVNKITQPSIGQYEKDYINWLESKLLQQDQDQDHQCKYIKRQGESCTLNNECKYPNCPSK